MKHRVSWINRGIAALLALALLLSGVYPGGALKAEAAQTEGGFGVGSAMALTYDALTDAEKALLSAGLLVGDTLTFTAPDAGSSLVEVDTDGMTVYADSYDDGENYWEPVSAVLVDDNGTVLETVDMSSGYADYTTQVKNFTAKVTYEMVMSVDTDAQEEILDAMGALYQTRKHADAVYAADADLGLIALAMDSLYLLANGVSVPIAGGSVSARMSAEGAAAVRVLHRQMQNNNGLLDLQVMNQAYASGSRVKYLAESGGDYYTKVSLTFGYVKAIANDPILGNPIVDMYIQNYKPEMQKAWATLKTRLSALVEAMEPATEQWQMLKTDCLREDLQDDDYAQLDLLLTPVLAQEAVTEGADLDLTEDLIADRTVFSAGAGMVVVNFSVAVNIYGDDNQTETKTFDASEKLMQGLGREQVEVAFAATQEQAQAALKQLGYDFEGFDRTVQTDMGETLGEPATVNYTVVYTPKEYTVTGVDDTANTYPYTYGVYLEPYGDATAVYDYYINDTRYAQATYYRVTGDAVITRVQGRPYTHTSVMKVLSGCFATEKETAILNSGALKGDTAISLRYPDTNDQTIVTLEDGVLTAREVPSDYQELMWKPFSYTILGETKYFDGKTTVEVPVGGFDTIQVRYRLELTNISAEQAQGVFADIRAMVVDAEGQKNAMEQLNAQYGSMGNLSKSMLNILKSMIKDTQLNPDPVKNSQLREEFVEIIGQIMDNCIDTDNKLKIYNLLTEYRGENGGMTYYLRNSATIIREVGLLSDYLSQMMDTDDKVEALRVLVTEMGKPEYADKLLDLQKSVTQVASDLTAPNSAINTESRNLDVLAQALTMDGAMGTDTVTVSPWLDSAPFIVEAPDKAVVKVTITAGDRVLDTLVNTYEINYVLTADDMQAIRAQVAAVVEANLQSRYYSESVDVELDSLVGTQLRKTINVNYHYTPHVFTVHIEGEASQTISLEDMSVTLAKAPTGFRYDYKVDGAVVGHGTYRFTTDQLDRLFVGGVYTIRREMVDVRIENMNTFLASLNEAGGETLRFSINDTWDTITVAVEARNNGQLYAAITRVAEAMLSSPYDYIGVDGEGMLYTNEEGDTEISLQCLVNAVVGDDTFGSEKLISLQNGGTLANTSLQLGDSPEALEQDIGFTIHVESTSDEIVTAGSTLESIRDMLTFQANGGVLHVDMGLTEDTYHMLLTMLVMTGAVDRTRLNDLESPVALKQLFTLLKQISADPEITTETLENTGTMIGRQFALAEHETYYRYLMDLVNDSTFTYTQDACLGLMHMDLKTILDAEITDPEKVVMLGMIKEYETGLEVELSFTLAIHDTYEAAILETQTGNFLFTDDLMAALPTLTGDCAIYLQSDLGANVWQLPDGAVLDLGGHTVIGSIAADGKLTIVDSGAPSGKNGWVKGAVDGDVLILGGRYNEDVSAKLASGLIQRDGLVTDPTCSVKEEEDGSRTYTVYTDELKYPQTLPAALVYDLIQRYTTCASVVWNERDVLTGGTADLFALLSCGHADEALISSLISGVDTDGLGALLTQVLTDLGSFPKLAKGETLGTYTLTVAPYEVRARRDAEGDYLIFDLVEAQETKEETVKLIASGQRTEAMAESLKKVVTANDVTVTVKELTFADGILTVRAGRKQTVSMNCSEAPEFAIVLAVILANHSQAHRGAVAQAINSGNVQGLKTILDSVTLQQLRSALVAYGDTGSFGAAAATVGVTADITTAKALAISLQHTLLRTADALKVLDLPNGSKTFGSFESAKEPGCYIITETDLGEENVADLGAFLLESDLGVDSFTLSLQLFGGKAIEVYDARDTLLLQTDSLEEALSTVPGSGTIRFLRNVTMEKNLGVSKAITMEGVSSLEQGRYTIKLAAGGSIDADGALNVSSMVAGSYVACTQEANRCIYRLKTPEAPKAGSSVADVWFVTKDDTTYLCADIHPKMGNLLSELKGNLRFAELEELGDVEMTIPGSTGRVRTGDVLTVTVTHNGATVFSASYTLVVAGDVNRDGMVNSGDAVAMTNIYNGNRDSYSYSQLLAADANKNGAAGTPRVDAGDAVRIMNKYLNWDNYLSNLKK